MIDAKKIRGALQRARIGNGFYEPELVPRKTLHLRTCNFMRANGA
jgi:hypothetical protein